MGIRIEKKNIVYESVGMIAIEPNYVFTNKEKVKEYIKKNPFPETKYYITEDLLCDIYSTGMWTLPDELTEEQREYIKKMIDYFL